MNWKWKLVVAVLVLLVIGQLAKIFLPPVEQASNDPCHGMDTNQCKQHLKERAAREYTIERTKLLKPFRDACLKGSTQRRIDECLDTVEGLR